MEVCKHAAAKLNIAWEVTLTGLLSKFNGIFITLHCFHVPEDI